MIVGHVPDGQPPGLNVGTIAFLHSYAQKPCGAGRYLRPTTEILTRAQQQLGAPFHLKGPDGQRISLNLVFKTAEFSVEQAGREFAKLIAATLPQFRRIPEA